MKRMSEVFELPLSQLPEADDQIQDANEDWALIVRLPWRTDYVVNAINHVDTLADALDKLLSMLETEGGQNTEIFKECEKASNAYWGIK
jgi:hypothetical protein